MGYQVGNICYVNKQLAEDVYFSKVVPTISADGQFNQLIRTQSGWQFKGQLISASLPTCDPAQNLKDGMELGALLMPIFISLWAFEKMSKLLSK